MRAGDIHGLVLVVPMPRALIAIALGVVIAPLSFAVDAQSPPRDARAMSAHSMTLPDASTPGDPTGGDPHAFHREMDADMDAMMSAMDAAPMTGNADIDFAAMMIPHHEGAIAMARLQLQYGTDAAMRRLAQEIIVTQQSEIDLMRRRLQQLQQPAAGH